MKHKFKIKFSSINEKYYFSNLNTSQKKKCIKTIYNINNFKKTHIPFKFKIYLFNISDFNKHILLQLYDNFLKLDKSTQEYFKYKIFFDNINNIPFNNLSYLNINNINTYLLHSKNILNTHIYGHTHIKTCLLQILSQYYTNPHNNNIIGFYGPPGVGKTTFAHIISKILQRPLEIINLCGAQDTSYLEGHSFTYEGAKYGKIINTLIKHKTMNPIIFFDEIDKISKTEKGFELEKLLINIVDTTQNYNFIDKYFMELTFDLSNILFIFSYNNKTHIDPILYDRIYELEFYNYNINDKFILSKKYIIPQLLKNYSFKNNSITFSNNVILYLIHKFSPINQGIRTLKNIYNNILSKIHLIYLTNNPSIINIKINILFPYKLTKKHISYFI